MACNNIIKSRKTDINWVIERARQISELRQEDVQIYIKEEKDKYTLYEIEFPLNPNRENIIEIIKWQEKE